MQKQIAKPALSARKIGQIRRIFSNPKAVRILLKRARRRRTLHQRNIFDAHIAGNTRTVKIAYGENIQRANLELISKRFKEALSKNIIKPRTYLWNRDARVYDYADKNAGVMRRIHGVGIDSYQTFLFLTERNIMRFVPRFVRNYLFNPYGDYVSFYEKNPDLTLERLKRMKNELVNNFKLLSARGMLPSYDLAGKDNARLTGYKDGVGIIDIELIDQLHPFDMGDEDIRRLIYGRKQGQNYGRKRG